EAREALTEDLITSQAVRAVGYLRGMGEASADQPHRNLVNAPYWTDGQRAVFLFHAEPTSLGDIEFFDWERARQWYRAPGEPSVGRGTSGSTVSGPVSDPEGEPAGRATGTLDARIREARGLQKLDHLVARVEPVHGVREVGGAPVLLRAEPEHEACAISQHAT